MTQSCILNKKNIIYLALVMMCLILNNAYSDRKIHNFDSDWKFSLGDSPKANEISFDDSGWRNLSVPHDWAFEGPYRMDADQKDKGGYKDGGIGWYRKVFSLNNEDLSNRYQINFDAIYMNSEVWINGHYLGKRPYGYISIIYDLTDYLHEGTNLISVRVDNSKEPSARWYHGCGIYGHVQLIQTGHVHIEHDGVYIKSGIQKHHTGHVNTQIDIINHQSTPIEQEVFVEIFNKNDHPISSTSKSISIGARDRSSISINSIIKNVILWSIENPYLYYAKISLKNNGVTYDSTHIKFGVRTIRWDRDTGFWLNGENIKLCGVSDHLEAGPVGAAIPKELNRWKIKLLKDMGCNAIRLAHNPQIPEFYDLCDEMGMLVMDEIFDGWKKKANEDYGHQAFKDWWEKDLRDWLKRDRNHPSIIIWSLGNETGGNIAKKLVDICHELDPTRLTTSGHSGSKHMDVLGVNGHSEEMSFFNKKPSKPFVSTEAPHTWQVRGVYRTKTWFRDGYPNPRHDSFPCPDLTSHELFNYDGIHPKNRKNTKQIFNSSYDNAMVRITARKNWELVRDTPWHSGHFRWTGFDYLGEAGYVHGGWPFRAFMGGALDLAGFKKDLYYFYQSQWTKEPMIHILPHWTHHELTLGTKIPVWVYSNCDEVELFLNGKSLGKDKPGSKWHEMQCQWMVPWTPGEIKAVGYSNGKVSSKSLIATAQEASKIELSIEGMSYPIVTTRLVDSKGNTNPYAENRIHYHISGNAKILSLESGNPINTEPNYGTNSRSVFFGLGRAFLDNSEPSSPSTITAATICGDKKLAVSNLVTISHQTIDLEGNLIGKKFDIFYSINDEKTYQLYKNPIPLEHNDIITAYLYDGKQLIFEMQEQFGDDHGLYWGPLDTPGQVDNTIDVDSFKLFNANIKTNTSSNQSIWYSHKGYIEFNNKIGANLNFYQENDGAEGVAKLIIYYRSEKQPTNMMLIVNDKVVNTNVHFPQHSTASLSNHIEIKIPFERGANTIKLVTINKNSPLIDRIILE